MTTLRSFLKKNNILKALSSIKITVVCLILFFILTFWGTVDQVYNGLYYAQQQFFNSWFFLGFGFLPFPGGQLVMWVLFLNLVAVAITRFVYKLSHLGILIIHIGLLTYFIAGFITFMAVKEAHVTLREGEGTNLASSYAQWELSVWPETQGVRNVVAYDMRRIFSGVNFDFSELGFTVVAEQYYPNSEAYSVPAPIFDGVKNASGIRSLKPIGLFKEPEKNIPGGVFKVVVAGAVPVRLLLYGGETTPTPVLINDKTFYFQLRTAKLPLPFVVKLSDFRMERHPNTEMARSYESLVEVQTPQMTRDSLISMNNPLRYKDFALYQASYSIDSMGRETSTLAVVKNAGRLLPYISTFIVFFGLVVHFLLMGLIRRGQKV